MSKMVLKTISGQTGKFLNSALSYIIRTQVQAFDNPEIEWNMTRVPLLPC